MVDVFLNVSELSPGGRAEPSRQEDGGTGDDGNQRPGGSLTPNLYRLDYSDAALNRLTIKVCIYISPDGSSSGGRAGWLVIGRLLV